LSDTSPKPIARREGLISEAAGSETVLYDLETDRASALNEVASAVFRLCDGAHDIAAIATQTKHSPEVVRIALDRLSRADLLDDDGAYRLSKEASPSRRDLLRRAGVGAAAALPIVTTILAPSPAHALSVGECSIMNGTPCNSTSDCQNPNVPPGWVCSKPRDPNTGSCGGSYVCVPPGCPNFPGLPACHVK